MKTKHDIHNEVAEILERRGFDMWWHGDRCCTLERGQLLWHLSRQTCNWIKK